MDVDNSDLTDARFVKADLSGADLNWATLGGRSRLTGAEVSKGTGGLSDEDYGRFQ